MYQLGYEINYFCWMKYAINTVRFSIVICSPGTISQPFDLPVYTIHRLKIQTEP